MASTRRRGWRFARIAGLAVAGLAGLLLLSFALPIEAWRTGELPAPPLPLVEGGPRVEMPRRVWIDTDAACGLGRSTDPDDCFAIALLLAAPEIDVVGVSTVFGNATLAQTDAVARALVSNASRPDAPPVVRGAEAPLPGSPGDDTGAGKRPIQAGDAAPALREALAAGPLTVVALGPLTNVAAALHDRPELQANVARLVAVMGRRPGHLFHPAEGRGSGGILFGHGPVFSDFNFAQDPTAATRVLAMGLPTTLVPYEAARALSLTAHDLRHIEAAGGAAGWTAARARGWLAFWREDVGLPGFYPFDLLAAGYVLAPQLFDCAEAAAWIAADYALWHLLEADDALLVGRPQDRPDDARTTGPAIYCAQLDPALAPWLMTRLAGSGPA